MPRMNYIDKKGMRKMTPYACATSSSGMGLFAKQHGGSIIQIDDNEYDIVTKYDDEEECMVIVINDDKRYKCFKSQIFDNDPKTVLLQSFGYNQICTTNKKMEGREGTRAMMLALIQYIKENHSSVNKITLSDESFIDCEGEKFNLYSYYMLKYGEPYYMKNFGFQFTDGNQIKLYEKNLSHIEKNLIINGSILNKYADYMKLRYNVNSDKLTKFNEIVLDKDLKNIVKTDYKPNNKPCCLYLFALIDYYMSHVFSLQYKEKFSVQYACFELDI